MTELGTTDLVAALMELHVTFGTERVEATFNLDDSVRLTVALEGSDLTIIRDGDDNAGSMTIPAPTIADLKASARAAKRRHG